MVAPAEDAAGNVPIVRAPITCAGDTAFVASCAMNSPGAPDSAAGTGMGYVSAMSTEQTLIAAGSRIIECVGSIPVRTYTGYKYAYETESRMRPFGHIAKALYSLDGNVLVVDSGNNEVYELDSTGTRVWPTQGVAAQAKMLLNRPTDACQYATTYNAGAGNETWQHTVIADSGNKRLVEWVRKFDSTGNETGTEMFIVSPQYMPDPNQPGRFLELEYQQAKPIRDPGTGDLWGYLACAANWNSPLIVEPPAWSATGPTFYPARINPTGTVLGARIGADPPLGYATVTAGSTWADWSYLTGLRFNNIRQVDLGHFRDGTYAWVVASTYLGNGATAYTPASADDQTGVFEFPIGVAANIASPYRFTRTDYYDTRIRTRPSPQTQGLVTLASGRVYQKPFFPTSAKRLTNGDYLIANNAGAVDSLAPINLDARAWGMSLSSEILRVTRAEENLVFGREMIPDPARPIWPEPLSMVGYAERW
jgi:hypothetical protein